MTVLDVTDFGVRRGRAEVVAGLNLSLEAGRITALLGPNGSGKSTTMLGILGLLPTTGTLRILGSTHPDAAVRAAIGFVPQDGGIPTGSTALEWIGLQADLRDADRSSVERIVAALDIPGQRRLARRLSGGERRRVALAAALVGAPRLLVLDEPTAGLDPESRSTAIRLIRDAARAGAGVLLSTHLLDEIVECADVLALMRDGKVIRTGTPAQLLGNPPSSWSPSAQADALRSLFGGHQ